MRAGEVYENRVQGDRFAVREGSEDTGGERLVGDLYVRAGGAVAGKHIHWNLTERFRVLAGTVRFHLDGRDEVAGVGAEVEVPPGVVHDWANAGEDEAHVLVDIRPAERFELMVQNLYGLANDGKTDARGVPHLLPLSLFAREFRREGEFVRPPRIVQRVVFAVLAPIARARGYRAIDPTYLGPAGKAAARRGA
ncbi:MAG TPA: cupin domain-containing protein [Solirubrobacteraceae bacterium]|nr:cupin domain-containing protein [Solirubrobacteraceae bacterium]